MISTYSVQLFFIIYLPLPMNLSLRNKIQKRDDNLVHEKCSKLRTFGGEKENGQLKGVMGRPSYVREADPRLWLQSKWDWMTMASCHSLVYASATASFNPPTSVAVLCSIFDCNLGCAGLLHNEWKPEKQQRNYYISHDALVRMVPENLHLIHQSFFFFLPLIN